MAGSTALNDFAQRLRQLSLTTRTEAVRMQLMLWADDFEAEAERLKKNFKPDLAEAATADRPAPHAAAELPLLDSEECVLAVEDAGEFRRGEREAETDE